MVIVGHLVEVVKSPVLETGGLGLNSAYMDGEEIGLPLGYIIYIYIYVYIYIFIYIYIERERERESPSLVRTSSLC